MNSSRARPGRDLGDGGTEDGPARGGEDHNLLGGAEDLTSKHLQSINLIQGNLLHSSIFESDAKENV